MPNIDAKPRPTSILRFSTTATTAEQLREDVLNDIKRRIMSIDSRIKFVKSVRDKEVLGQIRLEFEDMHEFWQWLEIKPPPKRIRRKATSASGAKSEPMPPIHLPPR